MSLHTHSIVWLSVVATAGCLAGCGSEPKLDVQVAQSQPTATAPAAVPSAANQMAPAHAVGGTGERTAPPIAPGAQMPPGHPPLDQGGGAPMAAQRPIVAPGGQGEKAIAWAVPAGWVAERPANEMRRAQYRIPGPGGDGECAVFYFGPGQGGDPVSNAERWASQFERPDGKPVGSAMKTRNFAVAGMKVLIVETEGTYLSGGMMGVPPEKKAGYALLGAVAEGPDANWFFKLTGPKATVEAQRGAFEGLLKSLKAGA